MRRIDGQPHKKDRAQKNKSIIFHKGLINRAFTTGIKMAVYLERIFCLKRAPRTSFKCMSITTSTLAFILEIYKFSFKY